MVWRILKFVGSIGGLSMLLLCSIAYINIDSEQTTITPPPTQLSVEQLHEKAAAITVKIVSTQFLGSGILLDKQNSVYRVLTNAHVLRADNPPYRIQTADGEIHQADVAKNLDFRSHDLAILQFTSSSRFYTVAVLGDSPKVGDEVFVAGFPLREEETEETGFVFNSGKVSLLLEKPLEGGYQVGYTNRLEKGMSGSALFNRQGEVVGVNGMHAYPLWDAPSIFVDGLQAEEKLHQQIIRLSWAVPMYKVISIIEKPDISSFKKGD